MSQNENYNSMVTEEISPDKKSAENSDSSYTHNFNKPLNYNGKTYKQLTFDWESLTGKDGLVIENELQQMGLMVIVPAMSSEYLVRMAARACTDKIGSDAFEMMSLSDCNKINSTARSYLLKSEF